MEGSHSSRKVCIIPNVQGVGGMVSFRQKLVKGLIDRGYEVTFDLRDPSSGTILVIGGTRDLLGLWHARRHGVRIVQRLDGMNWIHRKVGTGWRHFMRSEYGNFILSTIRSRLADQIIYQSAFSRQWWEREYGQTLVPWQVVHNGVDLECYSPDGVGELPADRFRILLVEGTLGSGYEMGLQVAVQLGENLRDVYKREIEIVVVGRVAQALQQQWLARTYLELNFTGQVLPEIIPEIDRSAHVLYAADLNPACPNSVIEALACGLPVAGFDTGALPEIITGGSGQLIPYGGDPWKLDPPDIEGLAKAVNHILDHQAEYRAGARQRAEAAFGLDQMVNGYLDAMQL
jgi:glycosyltransferase involved in cell wall biosynthesis